VSVPDGLERIADRRLIVASVFLRYRGSQLRRVSTEWGRGGEDGDEDTVLSTDVPEADVDAVSDILLPIIHHHIEEDESL